VWAYKEALLKALHVGLRIHPKRVHLTLNERGALLGARIDNIPIVVSGKELDRVPGYVSVLTRLHEESPEVPLRTRKKGLK
jgi:phosphopantetheinyl transferase